MTQAAKIKADKVSSVYTGKSGACCCGCAGKRWYPTSMAPHGKALRGYEIDAESVSDIAVKRAINKVNKMMVEQPEKIESDSTYIVYDDGNRQTIVYFETARVQGAA